MVLRTMMLLLVPALLLPGGCRGRGAAEETHHLPRVEAVRPVRADVPVWVRLAVAVEPMERATLYARVAGVVKPIPPRIDIGTVVEKDEPLIELDVPELRAERQSKLAKLDQAKLLREQADKTLQIAAQEVQEERAQEARAEADLKYRDVQYQRQLKLTKEKTVDKAFLAEALLQWQSAQATVEAVHAQVETKRARLKAAEVDRQVADSRIKVAASEAERLRALVDFATVRAPFRAVITGRLVDSGASVTGSVTPLLTVARTDTVRVVLRVSEKDMPYLYDQNEQKSHAKGNRVELRFASLSAVVPDGAFQGRVTCVAAALNPETQTMRAEVHLDNKAGHLKPQMTGVARLLLYERKNALTVPSTALVRLGDKVFVYYMDGGAPADAAAPIKRAEVVLGLDNGLRVEIRQGLTGQEWVLAKGRGVHRVGDRAIPVPSRSLTPVKDGLTP